jgi:hypothetical protein
MDEEEIGVADDDMIIPLCGCLLRIRLDATKLTRFFYLHSILVRLVQHRFVGGRKYSNF